MTRKSTPRRKKRYKPRVAIPNSELYYGVKIQDSGDYVNGSTLSSSNTTSVLRSFSCPTVLVQGDGRLPNPWHFTKTGTNHLQGSVNASWPASWQNVGGWDNQYGALGPYTNFDGRYFSTDEDHSAITVSGYADTEYNKALSRLYDEIRQTDLNALLSSWELRELASLKRQVSSSMGAMVRTFRSVIPGASLLAAGGWLTYSYVVKPMISDVQALLDFTGLLIEERTVKGSSRSVVHEKLGSQQRRVDATTAKACKIKVAFTVEDPMGFDAWRLGFRSPLSFLYESITLSFVLDWVYNVGGYLNSLESSYGNGLRFKWGFVTTSGLSARSTTYEYAEHYNRAVLGDVTLRCDAKGNSYHKRFEREVLATFPGPRAPKLDLDLASSQLLSAAALLRTLGFGGK